MNKEQTKEAIKVMQAYVDGKEIQYRDISLNWVDCGDNPKWQWFLTDYRIKPEPIEFDVVLNKFNEVVYLINGSKIDRFGVQDLDAKSMRQIKVREVLDK